MEITKNKLLTLINESDIEFDEAKERKRDSAYGEKTKFRPISIKDNIVLVGKVSERFDKNDNPVEGVKLIGWEFQGMPIFFTKIEGFKELQQKDKNLWIKIKKLYKNTNIENIKFTTKPTITKFKPRGTMKGYSKFVPSSPEQTIDTSINPPMKSLSASTKIKKILFKTIRTFFENPAMIGTFNLLTLPPIILDRRYMDVASVNEISNDKVVLRLKSGIGFRNQIDFQKTAAEKNAGVYMGNTFGENDKITKQYYLKRQYKRIYKNWPEVQKNNGEWLGKTKKYRLDRYNKSQNPYDVGIITELELEGVRQGNEFVWNVVFRTKTGSNLLSGKGVYKVTRNIIKTKKVEIGDLQFDDNSSIAENPSIVNGLIEVIHDVAQEIQELSPSETLQQAIVPQFTFDEFDDFEDDMNESVDLMIKNILKNII